MILNILIGGITTICMWMTVIFLVSSKYQNVIEPLDDEEFVLKECYGVGFHLMKLLRVNLKGTIALKMRKDAVVIYGEKYAEYYVSVYYAQRLTFSLFLVDVFMFAMCMFTKRSTHDGRFDACCTCCSELLFYCFVIRKDKEK